MGIQRVQIRVVRRFKEGWLCAEAVVLAVLEQLKIKAEPQLIRSVSAFNYGVGGTGEEHCGAFSGGVAVLGVLYGRQIPGEELRDLHREVSSFRQWFLTTHGTLNCRELVQSFQATRESECEGLAAVTADYLAGRQDVWLNSQNEPVSTRKCVPAGRCPFSSSRKLSSG